MRLILSALILAFLAAPVLFAEGSLDKKLQNLLNNGGKEFDVIIKFKKQPAFANLLLDLKKNRRSHEEVIDGLKSALEKDSESNHKSLKNLYDRLQKEGEANEMESAWLTNTVRVKVSKKALREIQSHPDVDLVVLNETRNMIEPLSIASVESKSKGRGKLQELFLNGNSKKEKNSNNDDTIGIQAAGDPVPPFRAFNNYGVQIIEADRVINEVKVNGSGITVAVLDTGVEASHPEFRAGQVLIGTSFITAEPNSGQDGNGHGTHCAGTVGGKTFGVAPGCNILSVKVLSATGSGDFNGIQKGIQFAVAQKVRVISMSLGSDRDTAGADIVELAVRNAVAANITCVIANGNSGPGDATVGSPGSEASCIAVGAMDQTGTLASFSSHGPNFEKVARPDVSAPGVSILSAAPGGGTAFLSGTSMATPHVAGVVALLLSAKIDLTPTQIKKTLQDTCVGTALVNQTGSGLVNAFKAVTTFKAAVPPPPAQPADSFFQQSAVLADLQKELPAIFGANLSKFKFFLLENVSINKTQRTSLIRLRIQNIARNPVTNTDQRVDMFLTASGTSFVWRVTNDSRTALTTISKQ